MDMQDFADAYPTLDTALGGEFHDSDTGEDVAIARNVRIDLAADQRAQFISELIDESQRALAKINELWPLIANDANRCLDTEEQVREWLSRMMSVWKDELAKIKGV